MAAVSLTTRVPFLLSPVPPLLFVIAANSMSTSCCLSRVKKRLAVLALRTPYVNTRYDERHDCSSLTACQEEIGHIDVILLSNSTWLGEEDPCVVFGMRGVIYAGLVVSNDNHDAHRCVAKRCRHRPLGLTSFTAV